MDVVLLNSYAFGDLFGLGCSGFLLAQIIILNRISISSVDVIHAIALPGLCLKLDAIPSRISDQLFSFYVVGLFRGQCSELCGALHGFMPLQICAV